jgi:hypothetical protein
MGRLMEPLVEPTALLGQWELARQVHDERAGQSGTAFGQLTLTAEADQIVWREQGTLEWNGSRLPFTRSYWLRRTEDEWWLYFSGGRPFHAWRPGHWVDHPCRADRYHGLITVTGSGAWQTEWDLRGPAKEQRITTQFSRPANALDVARG